MEKNESFGALFAEDDLKRRLPTAEQAGPLRKDRVVGVFYFLTHGAGSRPRPAPVNVTRLIREKPEALQDFDHPAWGEKGSDLYWGEPLFGYYFNDDKWVLRRHVKLLTQAGVDFLVFDTTNRTTFWHEVRTLLEVLEEYRLQGWKVPQVAYYTNTKSGETLNEIWNDLYKPGLFRDLWFRWEGKPFIIADPSQCTPEQQAFFTFRLPQWPTEKKSRAAARGSTSSGRSASGKTRKGKTRSSRSAWRSTRTSASATRRSTASPPRAGALSAAG